ncbi:MAG: phage portal protein [Abditibacteriota bacterium]|nr:phage portal protein [Abditibacteriota bacterium]
MADEVKRDLSAFLLDRALPVHNKRFAASKRFVDENGEPIPWEIRPLSSSEDIEIKRGLWNKTDTRNSMDISLEIAAKCTVFPDLRSTELQRSYNVTGEIELLKALLCLPGELYEYLTQVQSYLGYDVEPEARVEEAKN